MSAAEQSAEIGGTPRPTREPYDLSLKVPLDYRWDAENEANVGRAYIEVPIQYDPDLPTRGERRIEAYGDCPIVLREPDEQVLLHELLHVVIAGYGTLDDPHAHRLVNRIEVALWETGWRMTDPRFSALDAACDVPGCGPTSACSLDCERAYSPGQVDS